MSPTGTRALPELGSFKAIQATLPQRWKADAAAAFPFGFILPNSSHVLLIFNYAQIVDSNPPSNLKTETLNPKTS